MKTLSKNTVGGVKNLGAMTVGIIAHNQLWLLGAMCLLVGTVLALALLTLVVCSQDGDHRAATLERVVNAFRSHSPQPRRKPK